MSKIIKQYRYYADNSEKNYPANTTIETFNKLFEEKLIYEIGIQSLPGTKVFINDFVEMPIIIGLNGLFEISSSSGVQIIKLKFDKTSLQLVGNNPSAVLIVDTIEEGGIE